MRPGFFDLGWRYSKIKIQCLVPVFLLILQAGAALAILLDTVCQLGLPGRKPRIERRFRVGLPGFRRIRGWVLRLQFHIQLTAIRFLQFCLVQRRLSLGLGGLVCFRGRVVK